MRAFIVVCKLLNQTAAAANPQCAIAGLTAEDRGERLQLYSCRTARYRELMTSYRHAVFLSLLSRKIYISISLSLSLCWPDYYVFKQLRMNRE